MCQITIDSFLLKYKKVIDTNYRFYALPLPQRAPDPPGRDGRTTGRGVQEPAGRYLRKVCMLVAQGGLQSVPLPQWWLTM